MYTNHFCLDLARKTLEKTLNCPICGLQALQMLGQESKETYRARELWGDLLRLVGNIELRDLFLVLRVIRVYAAMNHPDKGGLARPVLPKHDNDLTVCEFALLYLKLKIALQKPGSTLQSITMSLPDVRHIMTGLPILNRDYF